MIQKVVRNRGGLHNRITKRLRLLPFTLAETAEYLTSRSINLDHYQIAQLYMAVGGVPHYLKEIQAGQSTAQNVDRMCFTKGGTMVEEFVNLYESLFDQADRHIAIVKALGAKPSGLTRKQIIEACNLKTGGTASLLLEELTESGFISAYLPYEKNVRDSIYKLSDEFSCFYLKYMENTRATGEGTWLKLSATQTWKSWSGMAFESVCLKHISQIKYALGISGVYTEDSIWRYVPGKGDPGVQIDLLIDRADNCISLCEMKFSSSEFIIDKSYAEILRNKQQVFRTKTRYSKTIFTVMVTTFSTKDNIYKTGLIQNDVVLADLFRNL